MESLTFKLVEDQSDGTADLAIVEKGLLSYNEVHLGQINYRKLAIVVKNTVMTLSEGWLAQLFAVGYMSSCYGWRTNTVIGASVPIATANRTMMNPMPRPIRQSLAAGHQIGRLLSSECLCAWCIRFTIPLYRFAGTDFDFELKGTRARTTVPRPGSVWIESCPLTSFSRSLMLVRPIPFAFKAS